MTCRRNRRVDNRSKALRKTCIDRHPSNVAISFTESQCCRWQNGVVVVENESAVAKSDISLHVPCRIDRPSSRIRFDQIARTQIKSSVDDTSSSSTNENRRRGRGGLRNISINRQHASRTGNRLIDSTINHNVARPRIIVRLVFESGTSIGNIRRGIVAQI